MKLTGYAKWEEDGETFERFEHENWSEGYYTLVGDQLVVDKEVDITNHKHNGDPLEEYISRLRKAGEGIINSVIVVEHDEDYLSARVKGRRPMTSLEAHNVAGFRLQTEQFIVKNEKDKTQADNNRRSYDRTIFEQLQHKYGW